MGPQKVIAGLSPRCQQQQLPSLAHPPQSHSSASLAPPPGHITCPPTSRKRTLLATGRNLGIFADFWFYPKSCNVLKNNLNSYLQGVKVAGCMILHIKVVDGELNATPSGCVNVPDTLLVGRVPVRVPRATEGTRVPGQLSTTTCENHKTQFKEGISHWKKFKNPTM